MAVVTAPGRRLGSAARKRASGQLRKLRSRASCANLASMPLTVAGYCCLDAAAVWWDPVLGLAGAGVLLIVLEHQAADEA